MSRKAAKFQFPAKMDALSRHGAGLLCEAIANFWLRRGYFVTAERFEVHEGAWGVRSNLVAGLPSVGKRR